MNKINLKFKNEKQFNNKIVLVFYIDVRNIETENINRWESVGISSWAIQERSSRL